MNINLSKNEVLPINLSKNGGGTLVGSSINFGVNWGKIVEGQTSGFFGFGKKENLVDVDLDASVSCFDSNGNLVDTISYQKLQNQYIAHSGDDRSGSSCDNDNETITINMDQIPRNVKSLVLYVNSFSGQSFDKIPNAGLRIYEGRVNARNVEPIASFDVTNDNTFRGSRTMVLGKLERSGSDFMFKSIGDSLPSVSGISGTVTKIKQSYL